MEAIPAQSLTPENIGSAPETLSFQLPLLITETSQTARIESRVEAA